MDIPVNYLAVLAAAAVSFILGGLWYSPLLFGKIWMKEAGLTEKDMKKGNVGLSYLGGFVTAFIIAYITSHFIYFVGADTVEQGLSLGFWIWLGFIATTMFGQVLWDGKSFKFYLINVSYYLAQLLIMGGILAVWK